MDWRTFIIEFIKTISWPATVIFLAMMLKDPLVKLIPLLKKLKYKELELEFSEGIAELEKVKSEELSVSSTEWEKAEGKKRLYNLLYISSHAAVMEAWGEVESAAVEVASSFWGQSSTPAIKGIARLGVYLRDCGVIDEKDLKVYNHLRELRNKAAHAEDLNLSEGDASKYIETAFSLATKIRNSK